LKTFSSFFLLNTSTSSTLEGFDNSALCKFPLYY